MNLERLRDDTSNECKSTDRPCFLTIEQLVRDGRYSIPIYQRNYAWGEAEIVQLIEDVGSYALRALRGEERDYYIGTLVVYPDGSSKWQVVDGQQRLTTLILLCAVLGKKAGSVPYFSEIRGMNLVFDSRDDASSALQKIFANPDVPSSNPEEGQTDGGARTIWQGRDVIVSRLEPLLLEMELDVKNFSMYLLQRVRVLRVQLPAHTDLNHYFEVMNSRGEQLAKHEVLKARLLSRLHDVGDKQAMEALHAVWDACAIMGRYVQLGFAADVRTGLFEEQGWSLKVKNEQELGACFARHNDVTPQSQEHLNQYKLSVLIQQPYRSEEKNKSDPEVGWDEGDTTFGSVISWPNFLLQVLALMLYKEWQESENKQQDVPPHVILDDKQLLEQFDSAALDAENIRKFTFYLLQCRFWLDQFVVKKSVAHGISREEEHWVLKRCKFQVRNGKLSSMSAVNTFGQGSGLDDVQVRLTMLQAAFHVSYPLSSRKYWLQGVLRWLSAGSEIDAAAFLLALEQQAKRFALIGTTRLCGAVPYEKLIHLEEKRGKDGKDYQQELNGLKAEDLTSVLRYPDVHPFVLNFLDYLLWLRDPKRVKNFAFTMTRRSVEHLHPQRQSVEGAYKWSEDALHALGNLCLVSHAMNSSLGDRSENAKFDELLAKGSTQSLKVYAMFDVFSLEDKKWSEPVMWMHHSDMVALLLEAGRCKYELLASTTHPGQK